MTGRQTRAERAAYPVARDSIRMIADASGGCLRPVQLRRTDNSLPTLSRPIDRQQGGGAPAC
jgi:hypothetical protein